MSKTAPVLYPIYTTVTVLSGQTVSSAVDIGNYDIVGLITPSTFDGTTITLSGASTLAGTYYPVAAANTASTAYTITTTASIFTPISNLITAGLRFIKLTCGTSQSTTDTDLVIVLRPKS